MDIKDQIEERLIAGLINYREMLDNGCIETDFENFFDGLVSGFLDIFDRQISKFRGRRGKRKK